MAPTLVFLLAVVTSLARVPVTDGYARLEPHHVQAAPVAHLEGEWRYHPGDDPAWAAADFDDRDWREIDPLMDGRVPDDWPGIGWFRMRLHVAPSLRHRPLVLWLHRMGALEVFIDGQWRASFGDFEGALAGEDITVSHALADVPIVVGSEEIVIAVRFASSKRLVRAGVDVNWGCGVGIGLASRKAEEAKNTIDRIRLYRFFIGTSFALGLLHFLLFLFLPERKENLMYALATWAVGGLTVCVETRAFELSSSAFVWSFFGFKLSIIMLAVFGVKFYHAILGDPPGVLFKVYMVAGVLMATVCFWLPVPAVYLFSVYGLFEQVRLVMVANMRAMRDAWLLAVGVLLSAAGALTQMLPELLDVPHPVEDAYLYGFLAMLLLMSAYQARGFARTYRDLQFRLADVRRLSEERVEQARRVKSEEMARVRLEEENKRQAIELEEAARREQMMQQLAQANRDLQDAQAQLVQSEKMASLGQLVAGIAHEINTPIGAIHSVHDSLAKATARLKEILQRETPELLESNRKAKASLKVIEDAGGVIESGSSRVARIVRRLKTFARLDEAELMRADVREGLDDTLVLLHHELKRDIRVVKEYGDIPPISCYPSQLNQVFLNLLVNARQAIGGPGEIHIKTEVVDGHVHVAIRDSGQGIPPEHLERIFDPGFTTKGVRVGTGLGLSICYRIVRDHLGEIRVESTEGEGSTFTVVLPMDLDKRLAHKERSVPSETPA